MTRRAALAVGAALTVVALAGGGIYLAGWRPGGTPTPAASAPLPGATDTITRGDLTGAVSATGTLRFADSYTFKSPLEGVVVSLPTPGTTLQAGQRIATIGDKQVYLWAGAVPAWRDFNIDMSDGADVTQLETALRELGHFSGDPNERFDWATHNAVKSWQKSVGLPQNGELPLGTVIFSDSALRVGSLHSRVGALQQPGGELFEASRANQVVNVQLKLQDQAVAQLDAPVTIHLPGGEKATGKITEVGTPLEKNAGTGGSGGEDSGRKERIIPVTVTPDDAAATAKYQEITVTVDLPSESRTDVLSVPVGALLVYDAQRFGVELVEDDGRTRRVPVTTGLFAAGRVEISGPDVQAGQRVVVPSR